MDDPTNCEWDGSGCVSLNICSNYIPTGISDSVKLSLCSAMKDISSTSNKCYFVPGTWNCVIKSCSNVVNPNS